MKKVASSVKDNFLQPSAAAKNTTFLDALLALVKLSAGIFSGSVALQNDGGDATMDTVSALLVWLGIKHHREMLTTFLVIFLLFIAAIGLGSDSIAHILRALNGTLEPVTMPYLAIAVEGIALLAAFFLFYYQRYVGRTTGQLTLIVQSVDNKNHIFIALSVIAGNIFSINGIYFVDPVIGFFIAAGIFIDAVGLLRETIFSRKEGVEKIIPNINYHWKNAGKRTNLWPSETGSYTLYGQEASKPGQR
jgi:divalent metal cation (Fe/Co/Zn/Cd) transporter